MTTRKPQGTDNIYVIDADMEDRSPEDIARNAVLQINALFDRLIKEQKDKDDKNTI